MSAKTSSNVSRNLELFNAVRKCRNASSNLATEHVINEISNQCVREGYCAARMCDLNSMKNSSGYGPLQFNV